jgi:hypothetical protein
MRQRGKIQAHIQSLIRIAFRLVGRTPQCYVMCKLPVLLLLPKVIPPFCRTPYIYKDVIWVTPQST